MKVNKNIEIIVISLLFLAVFIQARSVSHIGDIKIEQTDDKWLCDMIECPVDTDRCFVSKSNEEEPSVLKRVNICFSKDNTILAQKKSSSPIDPNYHVRHHVNFYQNGNSFSTSDQSSISFDNKAFNDKVGSEMEDLHSNVIKMHDKIEANIQKGIDILNESVRKRRHDWVPIFNPFRPVPSIAYKFL